RLSVRVRASAGPFSIPAISRPGDRLLRLGGPGLRPSDVRPSRAGWRQNPQSLYTALTRSRRLITVLLRPTLPPEVLNHHIFRAMVFPVDRLLDRELTEATVRDTTSGT